MFRCYLIFVALGTALSQNIPCNNECRNGSICVAGEASFLGHQPTEGDPLAIHEETNMNGFHCQCQPVWTGLRCDTLFESCEGSHMCYNGGECVAGLTDKYGNEQYYCDCSNTEHDNGDYFVGKYCEHKALAFCDDDSKRFCLHGGECNPDYLDNGPPCLCAENYGGMHCEYEKGAVPECDLDCQNEGHCALGIVTPKEAAEHYDFWDDENNKNDFKRCVCPDGYDGPLCENKKVECGEIHCFHGSTCVEMKEIDGGITTHCDCSTANSDFDLFAGLMCQYEVSAFCQMKDGNNDYAFCTNGGTCAGDPNQGCICPEGFTGFSCEFPSSVNEAVPEVSPPSLEDGDKMVECGYHHCVNGSTCVEEKEEIDGVITKHCDCSTANSEFALFAGHMCQYEVSNFCARNNGSTDHSFCTNGGICSEDSNQRCVCPEGFSGESCEIIVEKLEETSLMIDEINDVEKSEETLPTTDKINDMVPCKYHGCLHGSTCAEKEEIDGVITKHCDCSTANTEFASYAGRMCQYEVTSFCASSNSNSDDSFCTNGGICPDEPNQGCICPEGFSGVSCEVPLHEVAAHRPEPSHMSLADNENQMGECNYHHCLNGSTCVEEEEIDGVITKYCDCSTANTGFISYAGRMCQYEVSNFCPSINGSNDNSFCTNGGTCSEDPSQGCDCPAGFSGFSCTIDAGEFAPENAMHFQTSTISSKINDETGKNNNTSRPEIILEILLLAVCLAILALVTISVFIWVCELSNPDKPSALDPMSFVNNRDGFSSDNDANNQQTSPLCDSYNDPFPSRFHSSSNSDLQFTSSAVPLRKAFGGFNSSKGKESENESDGLFIDTDKNKHSENTEMDTIIGGNESHFAKIC